MIEVSGYPAFSAFPVTGPATSPVRPIATTTGSVRVTLTGADFVVQVQVSNARATAVPEHLFIPPETSWETVATVRPADEPPLIPAPMRFVRLVLVSGTVTGGHVEESSRTALSPRLAGEIGDTLSAKVAEVDKALADTAQTQQALLNQQAANNASAAALLGRKTAPDINQVPAEPGVYNVLAGEWAGRVVERHPNGFIERKESLEAAPAPELFAIKRTMDARLSQLKAGTLDPGSMSRIVDEAGPLDVVTAAQAGAVDNITIFALADGKKAVRDYVTLDPKIFGLSPKRTATQNTQGLALLSDWQYSHMGVDIPNMAYGGAKIILPPGRYRYGDQTVPLRGNIAIEGTHPRAAILEHEGAGEALLINGRTRRINVTPPNYDVASIYLKHLVIRSPEGSGVMIGSTMNPYIVFDGCEITEIASGFAIDTGERVYFLSFLNGLISGIDKGIYHAPYGDLLTVRDSKIATARGAMIVSEGPTLRLFSNNFEGCGDPLAMIHIRPGDVASTFAQIIGNRFGQEGYARDWSVRPAVYDIAFITNNATKNYGQATISQNEFITTLTHESRDAEGKLLEAVYQKQAPILTNLALTAVDIRNNRQSASYALGPATITTQDLATVSQGPYGSITVDRVESAASMMRGMVEPLSTGSRRLQRAVPNYGPNFVPYTCAGYVSSGEFRVPVVEAAKYVLGPLRRLAGIVEVAGQDGVPFWMDTEGSILTVPLTIPAGTKGGAPVWVGGNGEPTLTAPAGLTRQIGVLTEVKAGGAQVRVSIGARLVSPAMPTADEWTAGEVVDKLTPTLEGAAGSRYMLLGWRRLTTGGGHVLGTDWVERREVTGT